MVIKRQCSRHEKGRANILRRNARNDLNAAYLSKLSPSEIGKRQEELSIFESILKSRVWVEIGNHSKELA